MHLKILFLFSLLSSCLQILQNSLITNVHYLCNLTLRAFLVWGEMFLTPNQTRPNKQI